MSTGFRTLRGALVGAVLGLALAIAITLAVGVIRLHYVGGRYAMYWLVAATGALVGMTTGSPVWRRGAALECALKSGFGALAACAILYAARHFLAWNIDLSGVGVPLPAAAQPMAMLPLVAAPLGSLFGFDDDGPAEGPRVAAVVEHPRLRVAVDDEAPLEIRGTRTERARRTAE